MKKVILNGVPEAMKTSDLIAPCKDCPDRHRACHDTCERYQNYRNARTAMNEWKRDYARADGVDATRGERIHRENRRKIGGRNK